MAQDCHSPFIPYTSVTPCPPEGVPGLDLPSQRHCGPSVLVLAGILGAHCDLCLGGRPLSQPMSPAWAGGRKGTENSVHGLQVWVCEFQGRGQQLAEHRQARGTLVISPCAQQGSMSTCGRQNQAGYQGLSLGKAVRQRIWDLALSLAAHVPGVRPG